ncbi:hypothetical protein [Nitratidesulfovibrio sp. SRB-5]|uniref:hypothetical protein n=1 Tax=Nitratidesulfovibrio sp. SRB-5 TaxID=2872636 RepID=UPI0010279EB3|nr:hypothetical protein [Nitratidesulfovibrio sp. SRB-5]MBZ2170510.1 hypothetical protein [Nitratidesulfovibrio sp. SRB-5]RXF78044.1 hypothetical protein EKK70_03770 [Desulfovibrio sp. DS-1]
MTRSVHLARLHRRSGKVALLLLLVCALSLVDGLVGRMQQGFNRTDALPGGEYPVSGPLPPQTETLEDMVIEGGTDDRQVRLVPYEIYSGYWLGGKMWRGAIKVGASPASGEYVIRVHDKYGEKQNPTLIFAVVVWPDEATMKANAPERLTRWFGIDPFGLSALVLPFALLAGLGNFMLGRAWGRALLAERSAEIYKLLPAPDGGGKDVTFGLGVQHGASPGMRCRIHRPDGTPVGEARVVECTARDCVARVPHDLNVQPGDVVTLPDMAPQTEATHGA